MQLKLTQQVTDQGVQIIRQYSECLYDTFLRTIGLSLKGYGARAFEIDAPAVWNSPPVNQKRTWREPDLGLRAGPGPF